VSHAELSCSELVELVTDYLEGDLGAVERAQFEAHIDACSGCANFLDQMRVTIDLTGRVTTDDLTDECRSTLLAAFRGWERG
jgi:predicted anti-sigma-YlaC factor YlaD